MVDACPKDQRERGGRLPCVQVIPRTVLERRLDPCCEHRDPDVARTDRHVIVDCDEGYQSSLRRRRCRGWDSTRRT